MKFKTGNVVKLKHRNHLMTVDSAYGEKVHVVYFDDVGHLHRRTYKSSELTFIVKMVSY